LDQSIRASIVVGGRFHAFDLARELNRLGMLHRLVTTHPKFQTRQFGVPSSKVRSMVPFFAVHKAVARLAPDYLSDVDSRLNAGFSRLAPFHLAGSSVVHGFSGYSLPSLRWAERENVPTVLERSSSHILTQREIVEGEWRRLGIAFNAPDPREIDRELQEYALADLIAVPSLFVKRSFLARGVPEERLLHAPFGANLAAFVPNLAPRDKFRVIYAGHLSVRKGVRYLLDAFTKASLPGAELLLVGSPTSETAVIMPHQPNHVRCIGHVAQSKLALHYATASVFVMPSLEEGLAVVQAQALACGLPLICTTNSGGEDLLRMTGDRIARHSGEIDEFAAGYVVPIRDADAIARCLRWLATDRELLNDKIQAATRLRGGGLGWDDYARRVAAGYQRLVGGAKA
jgi:starch synthase